MAFRAICVVLLLSCLPAAGCGTVANLVRQKPGEGGVAPFGGVKEDVWCIQKAASGEFGVRAHPKSEPEQYPRVALMMPCAADLPLSLIGDVLTWPYTAVYTYINQPTPIPPVLQAPPEGPVRPIPVLPAAQAPADGQPKTNPPATLPEARNLP